jgi:hypothetical protein
MSDLFTLTITTAGAAFVSEEEAEDEENQPALDAPHKAAEVARILRKLATTIEDEAAVIATGWNHGNLMDVNGNTVGSWEFS